ncbi:hypothetical protein CHS0354_021116 [Potamilus streckersoni]|uniref:Uncharacterized protein n=1 Tax=Potamilus streckersoni TaxID=2493646 RepID=A0AAE0SDD3_9BIVA|nr:hypothetical protein CHS0354_021116 [Potamilus streckersoni]
MSSYVWHYTLDSVFIKRLEWFHTNKQTATVRSIERQTDGKKIDDSTPKFKARYMVFIIRQSEWRSYVHKLYMRLPPEDCSQMIKRGLLLVFGEAFYEAVRFADSFLNKIIQVCKKKYFTIELTQENQLCKKQAMKHTSWRGEPTLNRQGAWMIVYVVLPISTQIKAPHEAGKPKNAACKLNSSFNPGYMSLAGASTALSISTNSLAIRPDERVNIESLSTAK